MEDVVKKMKQLRKLLQNGDPEGEAKDLFRKIYVLHEYNISGNRKVEVYECGSVALDTPRALYRLLFLAQPTQVDFSDMYKSESLFALTSPDHRFVADPQFYKYALMLSFSAQKDFVTGRPHTVQGGMPGIDNGIRSGSPVLTEWCDLLKVCLDHAWLVYGGNEFEV